jgi:hypothetical protein
MLIMVICGGNINTERKIKKFFNKTKKPSRYMQHYIYESDLKAVSTALE